MTDLVLQLESYRYRLLIALEQEYKNTRVKNTITIIKASISIEKPVS